VNGACFIFWTYYGYCFCRCCKSSASLPRNLRGWFGSSDEKGRKIEMRTGTNFTEVSTAVVPAPYLTKEVIVDSSFLAVENMEKDRP